ncbi:MAG: glycosyltransferase family 4 protein [Candidatus Uhrbacteria bacterium]|nr:glycosyltransferase family 4 protein [Candidatus Uhrbacteria bacterium]
MKIGIVSNLYPPDARGGAELVASRIADALYERGHDVFVLTTQPFEGLRSLFPRIRERTLEAVYRFFPLNVYYLKQDGAIPFPIRALWHVIDLFSYCGRCAIRTVIRDEDPDVIITHNLKGIGVSIAREIQRQGVPHIHTLHDVQLSVPSGLLMVGQEQRWLNRSFLRRLYERGVRREMGQPNLVLSPSKFLADFYRERGLFTDTRVEILENPMPLNQPRSRGLRTAQKTQFLYVGQLEEHKGLRELLRAIESLGEDAELHIAGEGSLSEFVATRAELDSRVSFHGFVSLDHLIKLLRRTDAVIVPSICYENSPTVIYEAYLVGVPVIASRIGGIPELVMEGETGLLVRPGDERDLVRAMKEIHEGRDAWWAKGDAIRAQAQKYSIKHYVDQLEKYLKEIV